MHILSKCAYDKNHTKSALDEQQRTSLESRAFRVVPRVRVVNNVARRAKVGPVEQVPITLSARCALPFSLRISDGSCCEQLGNAKPVFFVLCGLSFFFLLKLNNI